jgi:hypothetical protein
MAVRARAGWLGALAFIAGAGAWAGCGTVPEEVSPEAIPVAFGSGVGLHALMTAQASGEAEGAPFPVLIDTATPLTTRAVATGTAWRVRNETLRLYDLDTAGACHGGGPVARVLFPAASTLEKPLATAGVGDQAITFGGILGGDLLQGYSLELSYSGGCSPSIALKAAELACSCQIADDCAAVLPFTLAGGGQFNIGDDVYNYVPTRVTLDACLEPVPDPVARGVACLDASRVYQPGYEPSSAPGVDVRLLVATGFPGVVLGASAYDRLRRRGAAAALRAAQSASLVALHFPAHDDPVLAAVASLGPVTTSATDGGTLDGGGLDGGALDGGAASGAAARAALALVGREGLLGACGELARSRRIRWRAGQGSASSFDAFPPSCGGSCPGDDTTTCLRQLPGNVCGSPDRCCDVSQPAAAVVEVDDPIPIYVVDDGAPILQEVNFDVEPQLSAVEGVVGSELLARLATRIDYPNRRVIARCAGATSGCTTFPRYSCPDQVADCGPHGQNASDLCNPPAAILPPGGPLCLPAPIARDGGI